MASEDAYLVNQGNHEVAVDAQQWKSYTSTSVGKRGHKMTTRELRDKLAELMGADPNNPVWDDPLEVGDYGSTFYDVRMDDYTDECDGSCQHPQCVYALDNDGLGDELGYPPADYTAEGLHFRVALWTNNR